jgi:mannose-1-phosphate guanylyltransferase
VSDGVCRRAGARPAGALARAPGRKGPAMRVAVILAGGWGERLWPMSTRERPKQLLDLDGSGTLVARTVRRVEPIVDLRSSLALTSNELRDAILPELAPIPPDRVVGEPAGRNTAPAIGLAARILAQEDPDAVMVVLPADHTIEGGEAFLKTLELATDVSRRRDALVTLGIRPSRPETEYGYLKAGRTIEPGVRAVDRFVEKPDAETAALYLADGSYLWNSGMFIWRAERILKEIARHLPDLSSALDSFSSAPGRPDFARALERFYEDAPAVSIDYGVMEKAEDVLVVPASFGWDDIGAWPALERVWKKDSAGNAASGDALIVDSRGCVVHADGGVVAVLGMEDVVVARTPDGTIVCPKDRARDVRAIVAELRRRSGRQDS